MQSFEDMNNAIKFEHGLADNIKELEKVNKQLARLSLRKEELTDSIILAMGHSHEGQRSYEYETWKVEIKTPFVYSLNKKLYESGSLSIPDQFNPIKESIAYSVDKRLCDKYLEDAPKKVKAALVELIDKKPGKASVTIKERC
jgi:hypothetical protein